jgi:hypothetical protein
MTPLRQAAAEGWRSQNRETHPLPNRLPYGTVVLADFGDSTMSNPAAILEQFQVKLVRLRAIRIHRRGDSVLGGKRMSERKSKTLEKRASKEAFKIVVEKHTDGYVA